MKRIVLINVVIAFLILALLEVGARIYIYTQTGSSTAGLAQKHRNLNYQPFTMWGEDLDEKISRYKNKKSDIYRILLVGGSTAQGFPTNILEAALQEVYPGRAFEVINLAHGGYNARQEAIVASIWGMNTGPDLIISITGANDLVHRLRMEEAGTFYLNDAYGLILTKPYIAPLAEVLRNSQLVNGIVRLKERSRDLSPDDFVDAIDVLRDAQHSINLLSKGACIDRMIVLQPFNAFKDSLSAEEASFTRYKYREPVVMELFNRAAGSLKVLAEADDVMFLDGRNIYDDVKTTIFTDDVHFRDSAGYEILAQRIAQLAAREQSGEATGCRD